MPSKNIKTAQRDLYKKNVRKLQRAGLLGEVDFRKKPTPETIRRIQKYSSVISGKASAVQAPDVKTAQRLRKQLGLKGSGKTLVIPREKGETYSYKKSTGEVQSTRKGYLPGEKIKKTFGPKYLTPPEAGSNKRLYYTIPERTRGAGRLKRRTFYSFDEMLFYMSKYDVRFEDIEDRIEIEEVQIGSDKDKSRLKKIHDDREKRKRNKKRKTAKKAVKKKKTTKKR